MNNERFVSIVMTYYDRLDQLKKTLQSFQHHKYTNFEVIIIDDGSEEEPLTHDLFHEYNFQIKVISMPTIKEYANPSVPFNVGFAAVKGDIIIIQNSECLHVDNILDHARVKVTDENYITYACFSLSKKDTIHFLDTDGPDLQIVRKKIEDSTADADAGKPVWKNHSKYRPNALHFTSAIKKSNLDKIGGFDQRYAKGTSFDDDEILIRIRRIPLKIQIEDNIVVVHQWHSNVSTEINKFRLHYLQLRNQILYKYVTLKETDYTVSQSSMPYFLYKMYAPFIIYPLALVKTFFGTFNKWTKFHKF
jgi:glycosyltransferase involved in cell wall biosynthesis